VLETGRMPDGLEPEVCHFVTVNRHIGHHGIL
jgi:hypothetical protein